MSNNYRSQTKCFNPRYFFLLLSYSRIFWRSSKICFKMKFKQKLNDFHAHFNLNNIWWTVKFPIDHLNRSPSLMNINNHMFSNFSFASFSWITFVSLCAKAFIYRRSAVSKSIKKGKLSKPNIPLKPIWNYTLYHTRFDRVTFVSNMTHKFQASLWILKALKAALKKNT